MNKLNGEKDELENMLLTQRRISENIEDRYNDNEKYKYSYELLYKDFQIYKSDLELSKKNFDELSKNYNDDIRIKDKKVSEITDKYDSQLKEKIDIINTCKEQLFDNELKMKN